MSRITMMLSAAAVALFGLSTAQAAPLIRDANLFETFAFEGVHLSMTPEEAFDVLYAAGYRAGPVETYEQWAEGSLNLVRGSYGGPDGHSSITLGRSEGRLALISQTLNTPGSAPIDVSAEVGAAQSHFGIASDEPDCRVNAAGVGGGCQVRDAEERDAATVIFTMTALRTMIMRSISRPKELINTL